MAPGPCALAFFSFPSRLSLPAMPCQLLSTPPLATFLSSQRPQVQALTHLSSHITRSRVRMRVLCRCARAQNTSKIKRVKRVFCFSHGSPPLPAFSLASHRPSRSLGCLVCFVVGMHFFLQRTQRLTSRCATTSGHASSSNVTHTRSSVAYIYLILSVHFPRTFTLRPSS